MATSVSLGRAGVDYDTFVEAQTREETLDAIREMTRRYATIAREASGKIVERLNTLKADDISPSQVTIWLEKAAQVERLARGVPTARVEVDTQTLQPDLSALRDDDLEVMKTLLERAGGRRAGTGERG